MFEHWGNDGMAPVIRDLGGLEGEVKNAGECRVCEGTQDFKGFGEQPIRAGSLIGVEGFEDFLGFWEGRFDLGRISIDSRGGFSQETPSNTREQGPYGTPTRLPTNSLYNTMDNTP